MCVLFVATVSWTDLFWPLALFCCGCHRFRCIRLSFCSALMKNHQRCSNLAVVCASTCSRAARDTSCSERLFARFTSLGWQEGGGGGWRGGARRGERGRGERARSSAASEMRLVASEPTFNASPPAAVLTLVSVAQSCSASRRSRADEGFNKGTLWDRCCLLGVFMELWDGCY